MLDLFLPPSTRHLIVYPTAINTRWGPSRLRAACERELDVELDRSTAVLFHNGARDTLVLYSLDADGDRCITKKLDRGVFLVPVPAAGQKYVQEAASDPDPRLGRGRHVRLAALGKHRFEVKIAQSATALLSFPPARHRAELEGMAVVVETPATVAVQLLADGTVPPIGTGTVELVVYGQPARRSRLSRVRAPAALGRETIYLVFEPVE